jgi:hypothetical protein
MRDPEVGPRQSAIDRAQSRSGFRPGDADEKPDRRYRGPMWISASLMLHVEVHLSPFVARPL